jgi:hypothetical protein
MLNRLRNPQHSHLCCSNVHAPLACAVPVIRWGAKVSSDKLRQCARWTACGHKGATIQHPGWAGEHIGFMPFPASRA